MVLFLDFIGIEGRRFGIYKIFTLGSIYSYFVYFWVDVGSWMEFVFLLRF